MSITDDEFFAMDARSRDAYYRREYPDLYADKPAPPPLAPVRPAPKDVWLTAVAKAYSATGAEPSDTATHESQHAVVAYALGLRVKRTVLRAAGGGYAEIEAPDELAARTGLPIEEAARRYPVAAMAGGLGLKRGSSAGDRRLAKAAVILAPGLDLDACERTAEAILSDPRWARCRDLCATALENAYHQTRDTDRVISQQQLDQIVLDTIDGEQP